MEHQCVICGKSYKNNFGRLVCSDACSLRRQSEKKRAKKGLAPLGEGPAELWPVVHFVQRELDSRGWTLKYLADKNDYGEGFFDGLMKGGRLTEWDARVLAHGFGTSPELWINLDRVFWDALKSGRYHLAKNIS